MCVNFSKEFVFILWKTGDWFWTKKVHTLAEFTRYKNFKLNGEPKGWPGAWCGNLIIFSVYQILREITFGCILILVNVWVKFYKIWVAEKFFNFHTVYLLCIGRNARDFIVCQVWIGIQQIHFAISIPYYSFSHFSFFFKLPKKKKINRLVGFRKMVHDFWKMNFCGQKPPCYLTVKT